MKPQIKLATARTPDGGEMELFQHDHDFLIKINGQELMSLLDKNDHIGYVVMKNLSGIISTRLAYTTIMLRREVNKRSPASVNGA